MHKVSGSCIIEKKAKIFGWDKKILEVPKVREKFRVMVVFLTALFQASPVTVTSSL